MLKINKLALAVLTLLTVSSFLNLNAQQRTYSTLSRFGLGEQQHIGYSGSAAMGYTGIGMRSSYGINNHNIASLTAMDSLSFYFDGGMSYYWQNQSTSEGEIQNSDMVFDYISLGFSVVPEVSASFGFKPLYSSGYKFSHIDNSVGASSELLGTGNLTQLYLGLAVSPAKNLSLGANISYLFGNIRNISKSSFDDASALKHGIYRELSVTNVLYDFGAQYQYQLDEERSIIIGMTFRPKLALKGDSTYLFARGSSFGDNNNLFASGISVDTLKHYKGEFDGNDLELASKIGLGISYNVENKLKVGLDYIYEPWAETNNFDKSYTLNNTSSFSAGAEFIPNNRSAKSYLARVKYRAGAYYRNENISINNEDLYNYGITFGLGLPLKRSKTSINLSAEFGQKGSSGNDFNKQTYGRITANFSIHELWFYKRKFE